MKYILVIYMLFFLLACGEQSFEKTDIRLLNSRDSNDFKEITLKTVEKIDEPEDNSSLIKVIKSKEEHIETDKNNSIAPIIVPVVDINTTAIVINKSKSSIFAVTKEINKTVIKSEKVQLAELEAKAQSEALAMQSNYSISLKKLEANNKKLLTDKELTLAKIESQKEIEKDKVADKKELALLEIKSKEKLTLEEIVSNSKKDINNKEIALAKLQIEKEISKDNSKTALKKAESDKEIAIAELNNQREMADKNIAFYKMIATAITALLVLGLLIIYFINRKKRTNELKMHSDELRHKEYMEASKQHNEHVKKMLDIITDENADKGVKKEVVRLLKEQGKKGNLIENKR